jgi:hypothetical protein
VEVMMKKTLIVVVSFVVLVSAGCHLIQGTGSAKLSEMIPGFSPRMDKLESWLTIEFRKYPKKGDLRDVKIVFSSVALSRDEVFNWHYIASHDVIPKGFMKGFEENTKTSAEEEPPLNVPVKVNYPLHALHQIKLEPGEVISLKAELFWAGVKQDDIGNTIEHVYRREFERK